jgi:hypothetical protein
MTVYELASTADDALLRSLLRENAMPSWVTMTMEREPSYFAGLNHFGRDWAVIAREGSIPVGMYACSEQSVFLNGNAQVLGYLGALRVAPDFRNRLRVVRDGYKSIREFCRSNAPAHWFTTIAADNQPARRLLEANLKGMPRYRFVNELVTLALPTSRGHRRALWRLAKPEEMAGVCSFYNEHARRFNFSPQLTPASAQRTKAPFFVVEDRGQLVACMALWNQQAFKQVVARGYRQPLRALLPFYNAYAHLTNKVELPRIGQGLDQTCLAFLAVAPLRETGAMELLEDALALCKTPVMTFGLHGKHLWLTPLRKRFTPLSYRAYVYTVSFDAAPALDDKAAQPEVALL